MTDTTLLYIVLLVVRIVVAIICLFKCGWKAYGFMLLYTLLTVISPEVPI